MDKLEQSPANLDELPPKETAMNTGMLWFDNDPRTALAAKIGRAADYYRQKYNLSPNICLVNPSMLVDQAIAMEGPVRQVAVRAHRAIQPGHLWIGTEE